MAEDWRQLLRAALHKIDTVRDQYGDDESAATHHVRFVAHPALVDLASELTKAGFQSEASVSDATANLIVNVGKKGIFLYQVTIERRWNGQTHDLHPMITSGLLSNERTHYIPKENERGKINMVTGSDIATDAIACFERELVNLYKTKSSFNA